MAEQLGIGVIGAGTIAEGNHLPGYQKQSDARLVAIADVNGERARAIAAKFGVPHSYSDYQELLANPDVDAVSICVPNFQHAPVSMAALQAGKHVLVEKPPALSAEEGRAVAAVVEASGRVYMVCQNHRFRPEVVQLKRYVDSGALGEIYYAKTAMLRRRGSSGGWFAQKRYSGGGALIDIGVHCLDWTRWILGNPKPLQVLGITRQKIGSYSLDEYRSYVPVDLRGQTQRPPDWAGDTEELAVAVIRMEPDITLTLEVSWTLNLEADRTSTEIFGTNAGAKLDPLTIYTEELGRLVDKAPRVSPVPYAETHARAIRHFLDCIREGRHPISDAAQAVVTLQILDAIYASSQTGRLIEMS
jgi:predicted dehydrogenase